MFRHMKRIDNIFLLAFQLTAPPFHTMSSCWHNAGVYVGKIVPFQHRNVEKKLTRILMGCSIFEKVLKI